MHKCACRGSHSAMYATWTANYSKAPVQRLVYWYEYVVLLKEVETFGPSLYGLLVRLLDRVPVTPPDLATAWVYNKAEPVSRQHSLDMFTQAAVLCITCFTYTLHDPLEEKGVEKVASRFELVGKVLLDNLDLIVDERVVQIFHRLCTHESIGTLIRWRHMLVYS